jgi:hypothetical protein
MNQRVVVDPFNSGSKEVDAGLGNAYPVVRTVYDNLQAILYVAANLSNLTPKDVEIQANDTLKQIEWRYVGTTNWTKLIGYTELLGADIPALIAELNQISQEVQEVTQVVTTARDQALQAVIDAGNASRLTVGTVQTSNTTEVSIVGNPGQQVINFKLQKGDPNTLTIGTVTEGANPSASITGQSPNQVLSLVLPRGTDGTDGETPVFQVGTVTTGSPGTPVEVTLSGTGPNYTLNFKIPKGDSGAGTGDMLNSDNLGGLTDYALARSNLGLGNVNNTSDANKPVSTAQQAALDLKVSKVAGKDLSSNDFSNAYKTKLDGLSEHFRGTFVSLAALQAAVPVGDPGNTAIVDAGTGSDATQYLWDSSDNKWVQGGGVVTSTDVVPEGTSNLYFQQARVLATVLSGFAASAGTIVATDTVLSAFNKTEGRLAALQTSLAGKQDALGSGTAKTFLRGSDKTFVEVPGTGQGGGSEIVGFPADETITLDHTIPAGKVYIRGGPMNLQSNLTINGTLVIV